MDGSTVLAWIALVCGAFAGGTLLRARYRSRLDDPRSQLLTEATTALAVSITISPLPRLFGFENPVLNWSITTVAGALTIFALVQLYRLRRLK